MVLKYPIIIVVYEKLKGAFSYDLSQENIAFESWE